MKQKITDYFEETSVCWFIENQQTLIKEFTGFVNDGMIERADERKAGSDRTVESRKSDVVGRNV